MKATCLVKFLSFPFASNVWNYVVLSPGDVTGLTSLQRVGDLRCHQKRITSLDMRRTLNKITLYSVKTLKSLEDLHLFNELAQDRQFWG